MGPNGHPTGRRNGPDPARTAILRFSVQGEAIVTINRDKVGVVAISVGLGGKKATRSTAAIKLGTGCPSPATKAEAQGPETVDIT